MSCLKLRRQRRDCQARGLRRRTLRTIRRAQILTSAKKRFPVAITISSAFDSGNIRVASQTGDSAELEIVMATGNLFFAEGRICARLIVRKVRRRKPRA